jgi:hypothetical protein
MIKVVEILVIFGEGRRPYMANVTAQAPQGAAPSTRRRTWLKVLGLTLLVTVPAFVLGPVIWHPLGLGPSPGQMPFFMVVSFFEALALGLGVSFLVFGLPVVRRVPSELKSRVWLMYLGIGWALVSWWPHGNLHMSNGDNMQRLLYIEYGFHVTLIISAAIVAYCFLSLLRDRESGTA